MQSEASSVPTPAVTPTAVNTQNCCNIFSFTSHTSGCISEHPVVLIRGFVSSFPATGNTVTCLSFQQGLTQDGFHFKCTHPLKEGNNKLSFAIIDDKGKSLIESQLIITYQVPKTSYSLKFIYVTSSDQPQRPYDGYIHEMGNKANSSNPSHKEDLLRSPIELATDKVGVAALLIQCAFHQLIQRHQLEFITSKELSPSITFHTALNPNFPKRGGALVKHVVLPFTQTECEQKTGATLYNAISSFIKPEDEKTIHVVVMGMTRWDPSSPSLLPVAHTALGGFPLALFGSASIHSWPTSLDQIHNCFQNSQPIPSFLFDDSGGRGSMWANCATGMGAIFHEVGHSFQARHTNLSRTKQSPRNLLFPCMGRGFDQFNRIFTLSEPSKTSKTTRFQLEREETNLHSHTVMRMLYNPFFSSKKQTIPTFPAPLIERQGGLVCVRSGCGIVEVSLYHMKDGDVLFTQTLGVLPSSFYSFSVASIRKLKGMSLTEKFVGCTALDIYGRVSNVLISLKKSSHSSAVVIGDTSIVTKANKAPSSSSHGKICYGSKVRFQHLLTGKYLRSNPIHYVHPNTSGFHQVTCSDDKGEASVWEVISVHAHDQKVGTPVYEYGVSFTLFHPATQQSLYSRHGHPSPMTHQQEVCCVPFMDENNYWSFKSKVETPDKSWECGEPILLFHASTKHFLHSHGGFESAEFTSGEQETTCWPHKEDDNNFFIAEIAQ